MSDASEDTPPDDGLGFSMQDRIMACVLLAGALVLAYVSVDVIADGRITAALLPHRGEDPA